MWLRLSPPRLTSAMVRRTLAVRQSAGSQTVTEACSRAPHQILEEWRAAEVALDPAHPDPGLVRRIEGLRQEHAAAVAERRSAAEELGREPGMPVAS